MGQTITDYAGFLANARQAVEELSLLKGRAAQLAEDGRRWGRELEAHQKATAEMAQQTVKRRLEEICSSYDGQIVRDQERLKKARQKREKAKSQGVRARIKEETEGLCHENQELKREMKTLFRQHHVPGYCKGGLYYSLYFPKRLKEFLVFLLWLSVCFAAVPCGAYFLLPDRRPWHLAALYVLAILVFGGAYVVVGNRTKMRYPDALRQGRALRDRIQSNQKKIRALTGAIRRDRDEARYNLENFDDEIAQIEQGLLQVTKQKDDAVNTFEQVTKVILKDEIEANERPKLEQLAERTAAMSRDLAATEQKMKEKTLEIADLYEPFLGREFLDRAKLDQLAALFENGSAANLTEAMRLYTEHEKQ